MISILGFDLTVRPSKTFVEIKIELVELPQSLNELEASILFLSGADQILEQKFSNNVFSFLISTTAGMRLLQLNQIGTENYLSFKEYFSVKSLKCKQLKTGTTQEVLLIYNKSLNPNTWPVLV